MVELSVQDQVSGVPSDVMTAAGAPCARESAQPLAPPEILAERRNCDLEAAIRDALEGPSKDLGRLCMILGEEFCLPPTSLAQQRATSGEDFDSDTTAPADQDQSSSSEASETGKDDRSNLALVTQSSAADASGAAIVVEREKQQQQQKGCTVRDVADMAEISTELLKSAWEALYVWRESISEGDLLDVFNSSEGQWYLGKVKAILPYETGSIDGTAGVGEDAEAVEGERGEGTGKEVFIHYQGWQNKYDETFPQDSSNLQPVHTHTKRLKKPDRKKRRAKEIVEWIRTDDDGNVIARGIVGEDDPNDESVTSEGKVDKVKEEEGDRDKAKELSGVSTNRYGRALVTRVDLSTPKSKADARRLNDGSAATPNGALDGDASGMGGGDGTQGNGSVVDGEGSMVSDGVSSGSKGTKRKSISAEGGGAAASPEHWICATCLQLDSPNVSDMLTCDGPCRRSFHILCLDVDDEALSKETWLCEDCERGEHACWQCGDFGEDNVMGGVFRCGVHNCGRFYHRHCVELNSNCTVKSSDVDEGEEGQPVFKFRCGYHSCDTCSSHRGGNKSHLFKCFKCPTSYHLNCIPPDARYHELALLCEAHPEGELPALPKADGAALDGREGTEGGEGGDGGPAPGSCGLPPLKLPKNAPRADQKNDLRHFRLPMSILTSYHSKPPPFQHICAMQFVVPRPPRVDPTPVCTCTAETCGDSCLNLMLRTECVCGNGIRSKYQNCKQGAGCGNRRLQNRGVAKVAPFREYGMGWGLKVMEDVPKGSLVGEYVGEVIDEAMVEHRMSEQRRLRPNDGEFYIMELGQSLFVDAKEKGNLMRLINHSCDPNCDVQAWNIAGYTRLGIYAKTDLASGDSLSYDYKFSTNETAKFRCMCGADNCRGTLAPKSREEEVKEDGSKLKGKARKEMLLKRERLAKNRQARDQLGQKVSWKRLSMTGRLLPGDVTAEVKTGPPSKYFGFARDQRIFLVRNALAGADLLTRRRLLVTKAENHPANGAAALASRSALATIAAAPTANGTSAVDSLGRNELAGDGAADSSRDAYGDDVVEKRAKGDDDTRDTEFGSRDANAVSTRGDDGEASAHVDGGDEISTFVRNDSGASAAIVMGNASDAETNDATSSTALTATSNTSITTSERPSRAISARSRTLTNGDDHSRSAGTKQPSSYSSSSSCASDDPDTTETPSKRRRTPTNLPTGSGMSDGRVVAATEEPSSSLSEREGKGGAKGFGATGPASGNGTPRSKAAARQNDSDARETPLPAKKRGGRR